MTENIQTAFFAGSVLTTTSSGKANTKRECVVQFENDNEIDITNVANKNEITTLLRNANKKGQFLSTNQGFSRLVLKRKGGLRSPIIHFLAYQ